MANKSKAKKKPTAKKPTKKADPVATVVEETQEATTTDEATPEVEEIETTDEVAETTDTEDEATQDEEEKATTEAPKGENLNVSNSQIEVVVTAEKFGTYKKGDTIIMSESTAKACKKAVKIKK